MAKEGKMKCPKCNEILIEKRTKFDHFETKAMVCSKGHFLTLTKEQAEHYARLKLLHQIIDAERKIIKIGNSMGFTLPDQLKELGVRIGKKVRTEAIGPNSFMVELVS